MYDKNKNYLLLRCAMATIIVFATFFLFASFIFYNVVDRSFFYFSAIDQSVVNRCGFFGAECAAFLIYYFGGAALCVVVPLSFFAYYLYKNIPISQEWERIFTALWSTPLVAIFLNVYSVDCIAPDYPGGVIGITYAHYLIYFFDRTGALLFVTISLMAIIVLLFRCSYIFLVQALIKSINYGVICAKKYKLINRALYVISYSLYIVLIYPIILFFSFIGSLVNGSAFSQTGLVYPDDHEDDELYYNDKAIYGDSRDQEENVITEKKNIFVSDNANDTMSNNSDADYTPAHKESTKDIFLHQNSFDNDKIKDEEGNRSTVTKLPYFLPQESIFIHTEQRAIEYGVSDELKASAHILHDKLQRFGITGEVVAIKPGPVVTLFEYRPDVDIKLSKILALEDDLAMALKAMSIRILAPIPGKALVGFEVANAQRNNVLFSELVLSKDYRECKALLPLILGKGTTGEAVIVDLAKMPHLLIAGSTGSGKSVALNALLVSLLCKLGPDQLKLILIDPKRLEFSSYADIAHLLFPIVTLPHHAAPLLKWVVSEMEQRYEKMALHGVRNSVEYNNLVAKNGENNQLPFIVVIIDELADLMLTAGRDIEDLITRIAQMARAAGIHMVVATQRPSVDVITGLIKANFPSRISFRVASRIDSRTILDTMGADRLLGCGDMLFLDAVTSQLRRVHGAYVSDKEINAIVNHIQIQKKVEYLDFNKELNKQLNEYSDQREKEPLYNDIKEFLKEVDEISISLVQRKFRIGYNRSARIIDSLELEGLIMPQDSGKMRKVIR